jgi:hypothetical protein
LALGVGTLVVAACLSLLLLRLMRTLAALERTLMTADDSLRAIAPEVHGSLGNVNSITAGVNVGLNAAGTGAARLGGELSELRARLARGASASMFGAAVAARSLIRSYGGSPDRSDGQVTVLHPAPQPVRAAADDMN